MPANAHSCGKRPLARPVDEEHRVVFAGGLVRGEDPVPLLLDHPFVGAALPVDHRARQGAARPPFPMNATLIGLGHPLGLLPTLFDPGVAAPPARTPVPPVEVFDVPATVASWIRLGQCRHFINRRAPIRGLIQAPVNQTFRSVRLILRQITPETARAPPPHPRRLGLPQPSCIPALIGFFEWPWP